MKNLFVFLAILLVLTVPCLVMAVDKHIEKNIQILKNSAAALQVKNPSLAQELIRFADMEEKESKNLRAEENDTEEAWALKVLRDASNALKDSNPDLSTELTKYADEEEKEHQEELKKTLEGKATK